MSHNPDGDSNLRTVRDYLPRETRLLSEYLAKQHPTARVLTQVRLGPPSGELDPATLSPAERKLIGNLRRYADALVIEGGRAVLYEAAIIPTPGDVGVMLHYLDLFPLTPELQEFRNWRITGRLLWAMDSPVLRALAVRQGLEVAIFYPPWLHDYLQAVRTREARPAKPRTLTPTAGLP